MTQGLTTGGGEGETATTRKGKEVVSQEVAEAEFQRFIDKMDLDVDPSTMDDEDKQAFRDARRVVLRAIRLGRLIVKDSGEPVYTPQIGNTEPITFYEPTGATYLAMDQKKKNADIAKMFASLGDMTQTSGQRFGTMHGRDLKVCQSLVVLFLA